MKIKTLLVFISNLYFCMSNYTDLENSVLNNTHNNNILDGNINFINNNNISLDNNKPHISVTTLKPNKYNPCNNKKEGEICKICDPKNKDCIETAVIKICQNGFCKMGNPKQKQKPCPKECATWFDGCNNCFCKTIGEIGGCTRKFCITKKEPFCLANSSKVKDKYDPCKNKNNGDICKVCDPLNKECMETEVIKTCQNNICKIKKEKIRCPVNMINPNSCYCGIVTTTDVKGCKHTVCNTYCPNRKSDNKNIEETINEEKSATTTTQPTKTETEIQAYSSANVVIENYFLIMIMWFMVVITSL